MGIFGIMFNKSEIVVRIVLVDNLAMMRAAMGLLFASKPGIELVGEAGNYEEAMQIISNMKPDIVLLELSQAGNLGVEVIPRLIAANRHSRFILLTRSDDPGIHLQAVQNGVLGVVLKTQPADLLFKAIRKVYAGEAWLERTMVATLLINNSRNQPAIPTVMETDCIARLNQRELEIVRLIGHGLNTREIAGQLYISQSTVRHNLTEIYDKVGVNGRLELLIFAYRVGLANSSVISEQPVFGRI